jgi:protein tyrosine phosphatase (PTP) superfamily phosphohydrolase (DUF442 family)
MTQTITREMLEARYESMSNGETRVCVYCDEGTTSFACRCCGEYKGLMSIPEWESYTGEVWE